MAVEAARRRMEAVMAERRIQLGQLERYYLDNYTPSFLRAGVAITQLRFDEGHPPSTPRPARLDEVVYSVKPGREAEYAAWIATVVD